MHPILLVLSSRRMSSFATASPCDPAVIQLQSGTPQHISCYAAPERRHFTLLFGTQQSLPLILLEKQLQIPLIGKSPVFTGYQFHRGKEVEAEEMLIMRQMGTDKPWAKFSLHHHS